MKYRSQATDARDSRGDDVNASRRRRRRGDDARSQRTSESKRAQSNGLYLSPAAAGIWFDLARPFTLGGPRSNAASTAARPDREERPTLHLVPRSLTAPLIRPGFSLVKLSTHSEQRGAPSERLRRATWCRSTLDFEGFRPVLTSARSSVGPARPMTTTVNPDRDSLALALSPSVFPDRRPVGLVVAVGDSE